MNIEKNEQIVETLGFRKALVEKICSRIDFTNNVQNIHTPFDLCREMIEKLLEYTDLKNSHICVLNLEFIEVLCYDYGVPKKNIWFITDCEEKSKVLKHDRYKEVKVATGDYLLTELKGNMKFDVIVGNPPYQTQSDASNTKTQPVWDKFVKKSFEMLTENGYLCLVHPSGWRSNAEIFKDATVLRKKQMEYLEIHSYGDGTKTFGVSIGYDWYVLKNCYPNNDTIVKGQDGKTVKTMLTDKPFIPNFDSETVYSMIAKDGEERVEILYNRSAYGSDKENIHKTPTKKYKYPIIYSTPVDGPTIWYSSVNDRGHFGIPKVILNASRPLGFVVDFDGLYGMSQFCIGIVGDKNYLEMVAKVIKNQKTNGFAEFMESCHFTDKIFNRNVISLLRKDFWKSFV